MKSLSKIILSITPIATIGAMSPIIASCSCSTDIFDIQYAQDINCLNKDSDVAYHSNDSVKNGVKEKINVVTKKGEEFNLDDLNTQLKIIMFQCFYLSQHFGQESPQRQTQPAASVFCHLPNDML